MEKRRDWIVCTSISKIKVELVDENGPDEIIEPMKYNEKIFKNTTRQELDELPKQLK
tara:strand:- start:418 stop:588 length:171 start_codon:yes stop_codon:yes gene_type:complete